MSRPPPTPHHSPPKLAGSDSKPVMTETQKAPTRSFFEDVLNQDNPDHIRLPPLQLARDPRVVDERYFSSKVPPTLLAQPPHSARQYHNTPTLADSTFPQRTYSPPKYRHAYPPPHYVREGYPQPEANSSAISQIPSRSFSYEERRPADSDCSNAPPVQRRKSTLENLSAPSLGPSSTVGSTVYREAAHSSRRPSASSFHASSVTTASVPATRPASRTGTQNRVQAATFANLHHELLIRQQPEAARACGFGERDRRSIDPPPIVQLKVTNVNTGITDTEELSNCHNVIHCALWSEDGTHEENALIQPDRRPTRRLMGQLCASPAIAKDEHDLEGCFFVFGDLSCRTNGRYRLRFVLMRVDPLNLEVGGSSPILTDIISNVFTVYTAKEFPGMKPSSALTRALKLQGINVQVKKGNKAAQFKKHWAQSEEDEDRGDDDGESRGKRRRKD